MVPLLVTEPVRIDLTRLERDPKALWEYYQDIRHRIDLLPPLSQLLRQPSSVALQTSLSERESALGIATLRKADVLLLARLFQEEGLDMAEHLSGPHAATLHARDKQALLPRGTCAENGLAPARWATPVGVHDR